MTREHLDGGAGGPELLLIRIGNFRDLLAVHGRGAELTLELVVYVRILSCGIAPHAVDMLDGCALIDLSVATRPPATAPSRVDRLMQRLAAAIAREPVMFDAGRAYLRVLMQVLRAAAFGGRAGRAREALLAGGAAPRGGGRDPHGTAPARHRSTLCADMRAATALLDDLRAGKLALAFQPIMLLGRTGAEACLYSEALLRQRDGGSGSAHTWSGAIEALERLGWITRLDCSVVWTVVRLLERYPAQRLGCNVSAATLYDDAWWRLMLTYLQRRRGVARRLTLEITETSAVANRGEARALIAGLHSAGVHIAIDDIGAGSSMFELLSYAQADVAKIDRSALRLDASLDTPDSLRRLVTACAGYSPCVVVEGIESPLELEAARRAGAHGVQGFLLERPSMRPAWLRQTPAVVMDAYAQQPFAAPFTAPYAAPSAWWRTDEAAS